MQELQESRVEAEKERAFDNLRATLRQVKLHEAGDKRRQAARQAQLRAELKQKNGKMEERINEANDVFREFTKREQRKIIDDELYWTDPARIDDLEARVDAHRRGEPAQARGGPRAPFFAGLRGRSGRA